MDSDERFKHLATDPRFKTLRKKAKKIVIDERFASMFEDPKFKFKSSRDKRGRKTAGDDLRRFYHLKEDDKKSVEVKNDEVGDDLAEADDEEDAVVKIQNLEEESDEEEEEGNEVDGEEEEEDAEGNEVEDEEEESEEGSDDDDDDDDDNDGQSESSSSDESDSGDEDLPEQFDWQPLDHDAEVAKATTHRLAIQNLDWSHLKAKDLYILVNSIRPPSRVAIYLSEFGKERLAKEEIDGPEELADISQMDDEEEELKSLEKKMLKANEYEDADEVLDLKNNEICDRIRRYQLCRMRYYYAIAEFESIESAEAVYKELNGIEYEGSSLELDLRFVPSGMEFSEEDKTDECSKVADLATYKAPQFINSALQQTTVKFTWDETDTDRQDKLLRAYTKEELDKDDLDAYLASETDEEDEYESQAAHGAPDKYKELLRSLDEEAEKKKKFDVDVVWGDYEHDEKQIAASAAAAAAVGPTAKTAKSLPSRKRGKKESGDKEKKEESDADDRDNADLDLLLLEARNHDEFKFDPDDHRFKAIYDSGLYNIDPSHPNFKRTQALAEIAEKKREKRQKSRASK